MSNSIDDLDLNIEEFVNRTNAELVNNITNLISRTVGFLNKRLESRTRDPARSGPRTHERSGGFRR